MTWPFITRSSVRYLDLQVELLTVDRDYWKTRAEQLIDAALARAGAIHQPTMEQVGPRDTVASAAAIITSALSIREIDSSKQKGDNAARKGLTHVST